MSRIAFVLLMMSLFIASPVMAQTREEKVRNDKTKVEAEGYWIYNDLAKGLADAKKNGKPLLVVLRCIPCEECVKLDDDIIDQDARVKPLLDKFVCVRIISTNGLDLGLFQFDTDQSFAVFMLNADGTIYGRYGTRSHRTKWIDDVSVDGLAKSLEGALALHAGYPGNKAELAAKRGPAPEFASPELLPLLKGKFGSSLNYDGNVVRSCIHCHQIGDAQRHAFRERREPIPEKTLFPYPHPKSLGLIFDPHEKTTVLQVDAGSPAERAGFRKGDAVVKLEGQPLLSIADVQWVLHHAAPEGAVLAAQVRRGNQDVPIRLTLEKGWRQRDDISWRASSWELRRSTTGGMLLTEVPSDERKKLGLPETGMALKVEHLGQFPPHDAAKQAGLEKGDVITSFGGRTNLIRESDLFAFANNGARVGDRVSITAVRGDKTLTFELPMQP